MKFLYKIYSNYDGFRPSRIPDRLKQGKYLELGWTRYLDEVSKDDECWVFFYGRHSFTPGVYVKGYITQVDHAKNRAILRVREYDAQAPLTKEEINARIAEVVNVKYRQVFLWPPEWKVVPQCGPESCAKRLCEDCETWTALRVIDPAHLNRVVAAPARVVVPAYWITPTRCYVPREGKTLASWVDRTTYIFMEFKFGEKRYSYPLARGIYEALRRRGELEFDAIVPIPLSPDKLKADELHRTRALALELGKLLGVRVRELLTLSEPISKRRMLAAGSTRSEFEHRYRQLLQVDDRIGELERVLLVDDVITRGSTLSCAVWKLRQARSDLDVVAASAGQMIVKPAVASEEGFLE